MADIPPTPEVATGGVRGWLWNIALKKVAISLVKLGLSAIVAHNIPGVLGSYGVAVTLDPDMIQAGAFAGLVALHDWLKLKTGLSWL